MDWGGGGGGEDLISTLPDSVLREIVTSIPTADAVRVWRSSPLNLDLRPPNCYDDYRSLVSGILAAHPGPGRRLRVDWPHDDGESYDRWLQSPALVGLQELGIEPEYFSPGSELEGTRARALPRRDNTRALPLRALFQFAPTLRRLRIGYHTFPSAGYVAALRLPHLELISLCFVDISEATLHGVLAGCPVLRTLDLDGCTGFATVRINSPTITSFAISPADSSTTNDYDSYGFGYENPRVRVTTWKVIIEDAPLLEKLIPYRRAATSESFQLLVVSAPRLRVLGSLSFNIPKLEIGGTVFQPTIRRVNRVRPDNVISEERLLMQAVMLATTMRTVKILALEDVDSIDVISSYLKCFPCLEKLYISASQGYRSAASYDKQDPIECLEHHLKMVAIDGYDGIRPHVKFAQFFVRNARLLELMKFRIFRNDHCEPGATKEWIEDQQRQLQVRSMASRHVKFHFVHDARYYQDVYCGEDISDLSEHIHDSSRDNPFDQWFESEKEAMDGGGSKDLISTLPDSILSEIVSRLPTVDAIRVQVLSTRWRRIWRSSPLNLHLRPPTCYDDYKRLVSGILVAHPGPGRRLRVDWPHDDGESYDRWLQSPALVGLQDLGIEPEYSSPGSEFEGTRTRALPRRDNTRALPERALFQFAPTLRRLRIGYHTFPSASCVVALRLLHLELLSLCCVDISEATLHRVLAGCPVLRTLDLDGCTGFTTVRINSPTITSFTISPADSSTTNDYDSYGFAYDPYDFDYENFRVRVTTWHVIIEDAPLLECLVPYRRAATSESFQLLVVSAPRLRVLGSLSFNIPKLEIGGAVFQPTTRRVNRVRPDNVISEERLLMQAVTLATTMRTVKILALEDVDSIDVVSSYLKCFPCLEKLYISASQGYRSAARYDKKNPIECLEHHLKMVAIDGYDGIRPHVKFAQFFVRNARLLELMKFRIFRNSHSEPGTSKEWIEDQERQLQVRSMASRHVKFHFVHDARYYQDVYCGEDISDLSEHIHDSSRDDPFDQWFESEKEALAC